jgi:ATP-dependent protease ClpP protease subunit
MHTIFNIDPRIKIRKYEDLINEMVVITVNNFDEAASKEFRNSFDRAHRNDQPIIPIIIDSYGGYVHSLLSMVSVIENSKIPVMTVVEGKAMSCGAILSAFGSNGLRFIDTNACFMMHDISSGQYGKIHELVSGTNEILRLNKLIMGKLAKRCQKHENYFSELINGKADLFLTPDDVIYHGMADKIGNPNINISVKVKYSVTTKDD